MVDLDITNVSLLQHCSQGYNSQKEDLAKIKSQFNRWIEGLEEAFEG